MTQIQRSYFVESHRCHTLFSITVSGNAAEMLLPPHSFPSLCTSCTTAVLLRVSPSRPLYRPTYAHGGHSPPFHRGGAYPPP